MAPFHEKVLPWPTLDLKINLGGALQVYDNGCTDTYSESWWVGWRAYAKYPERARTHLRNLPN